jgi:hypothetical protein
MGFSQELDEFGRWVFGWHDWVYLLESSRDTSFLAGKVTNKTRESQLLLTYSGTQYSEYFFWLFPRLFANIEICT